MLTKPRDLSQRSSMAMPGRKRRRGFSPLMLIGVAVTALIVLGAGSYLIFQQKFASHAATLNMNCTLVIPANPLSAKGLATPYQLTATNAGNGPCNEANPNQSAFVQAAILNPATGQISAYEPLVIDQGTQPAVAPVVPTLPAKAVVGLWFGFNGNALTQQQTRHVKGQLAMRGGANANCVNGTPGSPFGQFSYCNAAQFFHAANRAIAGGLLKVPSPGTTNNGQACPTTRSFAIVDMDQSDNVQTLYLANGNGQTAQFNTANQAALAGATTLGNPSDNALVTRFVDPALGCTPWSVPDLANPGGTTSTLATDELQAAAFQAAPIALIPGGDDMTLVNGVPNLTKTNLYRVGVDQTRAASLNGNAVTSANTTTYCKNIDTVVLPFLQLNMNGFSNRPSPDGGATANSLFTFLANRLNATLGAGGLNCVGLLNIQNPVTLTTTNNVVTAATIQNPPLAVGATSVTPTVTTTTTAKATGTVIATLDTNAGNAQVALNLNITNFTNQAFFVNINNTATNRQVLHQMENTDGNGANAAATVINGLQGLAAIPTTWVAIVTDANGNVLGIAPVVSAGATGTATLTATSTGTTASAATSTAQPQ